MVRLPKEQAKLLAEFIPHDGEPTYLYDRISALPYEAAVREMAMARALEEKSFISFFTKRQDIRFEGSKSYDGFLPDGTYVGDIDTTIHCPLGFLVLADGLVYAKESRRRLVHGLLTVVATAALSGLFAWAFNAALPS